MNAPAGGPAVGEPTKTSGMAIASLVLGLIGIAPVAIVYGILALRRIRRSETRLAGRGMAIAGIVLGVLGLLLVGLGFALASNDSSDEERTNAERFSGEKRAIAFLVDRYEQLADEEKFSEVCSELLTDELVAVIDKEAGKSCPAALADELAGFLLVDTVVGRIDVSGTTAMATYTEAGERGKFFLAKQDGRWRIDGIE